MITFAMRATPWVAWLALWMATTSLFFASEATVLRIYDWARPPVVMTWAPDPLPDGRYAVRFSGVKLREDCALLDVEGWGVTAGQSRHRLLVERVGGRARNVVHPAGPFGPSAQWTVDPPPVGEMRIEAEFRCGDRPVIVPVERAR